MTDEKRTLDWNEKFVGEFKDDVLSGKLGLCKDFECKLEFEDGCEQWHHVERPIKVAPQVAIALRVQEEEMLEMGAIKLATTGSALPGLVVKKPTPVGAPQQWRYVHDLRKLNSQLKDDNFAVPDIQDSLRRMAGCKYYTVLDIYKGF